MNSTKYAVASSEASAVEVEIQIPLFVSLGPHFVYVATNGARNRYERLRLATV